MAIKRNIASTAVESKEAAMGLEHQLEFVDEAERRLDSDVMRENVRVAHELRGRHERRAYLAEKRAERAKARGLNESAKAHRKRVREACRKAARRERGEFPMTEED